jgi:uncharacterized cupredoxin-like copper-binding protein
MKTKMTRRRMQMAALAVLALLAAGCGGDDDEAETRTVIGADYAFRGLPKEVKAGSTLVLTNESPRELHELVAVRLPDSEKRPVSELLKLPEDQQNAIFGRGEPAMVLLAPPNRAPQIQAVGNGTLTEKGRYAIICSIPVGADPNAFLNAPPGGGPPQVSGGPPHFVQGMFAELKVT